MVTRNAVCSISPGAMPGSVMPGSVMPGAMPGYS